MSSNKDKKHRLLFIFDDAVMMAALFLNLLLIVFEWLFSYAVIQEFLRTYAPGFFSHYSVLIHENFILIDLGFVAFYLAEFLVSWVFAVRNKWYGEWFYYPFVHWYDLLGCIPVGSLRFFRVLRVFSIIIRLHKVGIVDLRKTALFRQLKKYYEILVEEVSDRVVINVLGGVQREMRDGGQVVERALNEVVKPNRKVIAERLSRRLSDSLAASYAANKASIQDYVQDTIADACRKNDKMELMKAIPMVGRRLSEVLEAVIADIVINVVDKGIGDLASKKSEALIDEALGLIVAPASRREEKDALRPVAVHMLIDVIDIVKDQVNRKRWKEEALMARQLD